MNKPIDVFYPYSWFFTNLMVYMTYGGSMPIMYILGTIHFLLAYLSYKFLFIWYNRTAYGFDLEIPMYSVRLMKWAVFVHLLFNIFMYTNKRLLTPDNYTTDDHYRPKAAPPHIFYRRRYDIFSNFSVILVFILVVVCYLIYKCCICPIYKCCQT